MVMEGPSGLSLMAEVDRIAGAITDLRCAMHTLKDRIVEVYGVDSLAFRKAYDVEQRLANAQHDAYGLEAATAGQRSFAGLEP